ncbi:MAG: flagellar assembly protein FliH [Gammaproteobacteria bacterium]
MGNIRRIITDSEAAQYTEWQEPLVQGRIASEMDGNVKPLTANQVQMVQKDAYDEAFEQGREAGLQKGYQEGKAKAEAELAQSLKSLRVLCQTLDKPLEQLDDEIENNLAELTLAIARQLVRREIKTEPGEIVAVVRQAVSALPVSARNPTIYLHPEDMQLVRNALSIGDDENGWRLEEDLLLSRGDCKVQTESSYIDATIEARLAAIAVNMLGDDRRQDDESAS